MRGQGRKRTRSSTTSSNLSISTSTADPSSSYPPSHMISPAEVENDNHDRRGEAPSSSMAMVGRARALSSSSSSSAHRTTSTTNSKPFQNLKKYINVRPLISLPSQLKLEDHVKQEFMEWLQGSPKRSNSSLREGSGSVPPVRAFDFIDFQRLEPSVRESWLDEHRFRPDDLKRRDNRWRTVDRHSGASTQLIVFQCKCGIPPKNNGSASKGRPATKKAKRGHTMSQSPVADENDEDMAGEDEEDGDSQGAATAADGDAARPPKAKRLGGSRTYPYVKCKAFVHMTCDVNGIPLVVRGFFEHTPSCIATQAPPTPTLHPEVERLAISQLELNHSMRLILDHNQHHIRNVLGSEVVKEWERHGYRANLLRSDVRNLRRSLLRKRPDLKKVHQSGGVGWEAENRRLATPRRIQTRGKTVSGTSPDGWSSGRESLEGDADAGSAEMVEPTSAVSDDMRTPPYYAYVLHTAEDRWPPLVRGPGYNATSIMLDEAAPSFLKSGQTVDSPRPWIDVRNWREVVMMR
ncbi:hypothetical protein HDU97_002391 [Phlyctochytrium planicorne]|nr:hypothetical protein HDU97_002391 [Phlyctochytrium planicorne]